MRYYLISDYLDKSLLNFDRKTNELDVKLMRGDLYIIFIDYSLWSLDS